MTHGILVIDKPAGLTSAATVEHVRRTLNLSRAGHGGTLDPLATGVLAICVGAATKLAQFLLADDKTYLADGILGIETDTLDRTGRIIAENPTPISRSSLLAALASHTGEQDQIPPMYSALKHNGVRLHRRARAGEDIERAPRRIRIDHLELLAFDPPHFRLSIACSKGTYVRSLIADLGRAVGSCAHLAELRRTRSGRFTIDQALSLDNLTDPQLIPPEQATDLPRVVVPPTHVAQVLSGVQLPLELLRANTNQFQLLDEQDRLLAVAHAEAGRTIYDRVFPELSGA